jgi:hypothetical protein
MTLLGNDINMIVIQLTLYNLGKVKLLQLVPVRRVVKDLRSNHWLTWTSGIVLTNIAVSCARGK